MYFDWNKLGLIIAGYSDLVVTRLTAVWEDTGSSFTIVVYSLGHRLCTLTAVPRSTRPSTICEAVKWVSAFELSSNQNQNLFAQKTSNTDITSSDGS